MLDELTTAVADHRFAALAALAFAGGVAVQAYLPVLGGPISKALFGLGIGLSCFDGGYSLRAGEDRSAELREQVEQLNQSILATAAIADAANKRTEAAQIAREAEQKKVADYEKKLKGDCALSLDDARFLQQLGVDTADPTGAVRKSGSRSRAQSR